MKGQYFFNTNSHSIGKGAQRRWRVKPVKSKQLQLFFFVSNNYCIFNRRPEDLAFCYADAPKAKRELGWYAKRTLEDMWRDAWNFEKALQEQN